MMATNDHPISFDHTHTTPRRPSSSSFSKFPLHIFYIHTYIRCVCASSGREGSNDVVDFQEKGVLVLPIS